MLTNHLFEKLFIDQGNQAKSLDQGKVTLGYGTHF